MIGLEKKLEILYIESRPKKKNPFNPEESVDFMGNGPFIQYTYARIQSLFVKQF
jgi:arginyl-tRNA synthetase